MKTKKAVSVLSIILLSYLRVFSANDSLTSIGVYRIKSTVLSDVFTEVLTDNLESRLLSFASYRVIARSNLDVLITEDRLIKSGMIPETTSEQDEGTISSVDKILTGSVNRIGRSFSITLKILDTQSGRIEKALQKTHYGSEEGLLPVSSRLLDSLCRNSKIEITGKKSEPDGKSSNTKNQESEKSSQNQHPTKEVHYTKKDSVVSFDKNGMNRPNVKITSADDSEKESLLGRQIGIGALVIFCILTATVVSSKTN